MSFFKKIFKDYETEKNNSGKQLRNYTTPDYSAYVYIRPDDKIFIVSLTDQINQKYKEIASQYRLAQKLYNEEFRRPVQVKDYRKSFEVLSHTFELLAIYFCKRKGFQVENKDVFDLAKILDERAFNRDQMNVVNGILALIDKYEGNALPVSDYDVKTHFISLGIIVKLFKEAVIGKSINNVPCTFEKMREKEAAKAQRKAEKKELGQAMANDPNLHAVVTIEREYEKAKNYIRGNDAGRVMEALNNTVIMATRRICKLTEVSMKTNSQPKSIQTLLNNLYMLELIGKKYRDIGNCVTEMYETHPGGRGIKKEFLQEMIQLVGSTVIPTLKEISSYDTLKKKMLPDLVAPSFKSMESKNNSGNEIDKRFPNIRVNMEKANRRLKEGDFDEALTALRKVMELIAEKLCEKYNLYFEENPTLQIRIDAIVKAANYTDIQRDTMHKARMLGNKGSHYNQEEPTASNVTEAIELVKKCIGLFTEEMFGASGGNNSPKLDPDYYNGTRRYYGRWSRIFNRQELMLNLEYVKLERKANAGDVEAMLDIASGFFNKKIDLDVNGLVLAPKSNLYEFYPDAYDARYYHWILKACDTAYRQWVSGKDVPLTYIATALVEGMKFLCCHKISEKGNIKRPTATSLYTITQKMFEEEILDGPDLMMDMANMLICMFEEYGDGDENGSILAPIHGKTKKHSVKWYLYLYNKHYDEDAEVILSPRLLIREEDIGKTYAEVYDKYK